MYPLFNKKDIEPFDQEFVYPGKQIYVFDLNGAWIPGRININKTEGKLRAEINPVPYYVRNWQSLEHKKNAQEFSEHDFWAENKIFYYAFINSRSLFAYGWTNSLFHIQICCSRSCRNGKTEQCY